MNKIWYYRRGLDTYGPFSPQELKALAASGQLLLTDDVKKDPSSEWTQAVNVRGLISAIVVTDPGSTQRDSYLAERSGPTSADTPVAAQSETNTPTVPDSDSRDAIKELMTNQAKDPSAMDEWYYTRDGQRSGPMKSDRLKALATAGGIGPDDLVWKQGMDAWVVASQIKGLLPAATLAQIGPPPLPAPSTNPHPPAYQSANDPTASQSALGGQANSRVSTVPNDANREVSHSATQSPRKGFAITGLVLGICGVVISIIPCLYFIGIIPDLLGIVFSSLALLKVRAGTGSGRRMAIGGLVCGIIGVLLWLVLIIAASKSLSDAGDAFRKLDQEMNKARSRF